MATTKLVKKRGGVLAIEKERRTLISFLFRDCDLIEGSYREALMRCGHSGCRCERGMGHLVARISCWQEGKLKHKVVRVADKDWVQKMAANCQATKQALAKLKKLNDKEGEILKDVVKSKSRRYE